MLTDLLKSSIAQYNCLLPNELTQFCDFFQSYSLQKKELFLQEGAICEREAFVARGLFRVFHIDPNGFEQVLYFAMEGWWITDIDSFTNQRPSQLYIEALEDSEILVISKKDKDAAYQALPALHHLYRVMTEKTHIALQRRMLDNLSKTADQRYLDFIGRYPPLAQRLTNIQIAAYLGISHEFVSKIRRKITQKS
jgi:CRP-like cAMP-binding protein